MQFLWPYRSFCPFEDVNMKIQDRSRPQNDPGILDVTETMSISVGSNFTLQNICSCLDKATILYDFKLITTDESMIDPFR